MATRIATFDWSATPLGPIESWPLNLRSSLAMLLENPFPMALMWGPELRLLYNDGFAAVMADKHPEGLGQPVARFCADLWDRVAPQAKAVLCGEGAAWNEHRYLPVQRREFIEETYFTLSYSPVREDANEIGGVLMIGQETTRQVQQDRKLRTLYDLARTLIATPPSAAEVCSLAARVLADNPADIPFAMFYLVDESLRFANLVASTGLDTYRGPGAPARVELRDDSLVGEVYRSGSMVRTAEPIVKFGPMPGGRWNESPREVVGVPLAPEGRLHPSGVIVYGLSPRRPIDEIYLAFFELATGQVAMAIRNARAHHEERRQAEALTELERDRLSSLIMQVPVGISILEGSELRFTVANPKFLEIARGRPVLGRPVLEAFPEAAGTETYAKLRRTFATGELCDLYEHPFTLEGSEGGPHHGVYQSAFRALRDMDGKIIGVVCVHIELTEQVKLRTAIEAAREDAERANRSKDEFLAMLGHELRNPLAPILTALELMRLRDGDAKDRERAVIERQAEHLARLVDDLLDISRVTRGKVELRRQPIEIAAVIAKAIETATPLLEQRHHELVTKIPAQGLCVDGDPARLTQIFSNLLTNAAKYTELGGLIVVQASRIDDEIAVSVSDTGRGISAEMLPRIFAPFVQERQHLDRSQGGLGLGLAIVKSLVDLHGGQIEVSSEGLGRGSKFTVRLPRYASVANASPRVGPELAPPAHDQMIDDHRAMVLVVDDNEDAASLLAEALDRLGYATCVANDGPKALALAAKVVPDLALLDIGLPVMDGYELARRLRKLPGWEHVPLVAVTGYGQERDKQLARDAGFDKHLVKPLNLATLKKTLAETMKPSAYAAGSSGSVK